MWNGSIRSLTISLLALVLALGPTTASAVARTIDGQTVRVLATGWGAEGFYAKTVDSAPVVDGCGGNIYLIAPSHPLLKEMVAMLMSAMQNQTRVDFYIDGCTESGAMHLKAVTIYR
jgi:hypothetical protein